MIADLKKKIMKKIFVLIIVVVNSLFVNAQGIQFYTSSLDSAKAQAAKDKKLIFIDCFTTWCGPCKRMAANTFPDPEVGTYFNTNFIPMQIDMEKEGDGLVVSKKYNITAFPTLLVIDAQGNMIHRETGMLDPAAFLTFGHTAMNPEQRLSYLVDKYKSGQRDTAFIKKYLRVVGGAGTDVKEAADWYLYNLKTEELFEPDNFNLVYGYVHGSGTPIFKSVLANYEKYATTPEMKGAVEKYVENNFGSDLVVAGKTSEDSFAVASAIIRKTGYKNADRIIDDNIKGFRQYQGKMNEYAKLAIAYEDKYQPDNFESHLFTAKLLSVFDMEDKVTDKPSLARALGWLKQAEAMKPTAGEDTSARIENNTAIALVYHKMGNDKEALKAAKVAQAWVNKYNVANANEKNIGMNNYTMANIYNKIGEKKMALKQANIVMDYAKRANIADTKQITALIDMINGVKAKS
jgi:thioredoxin-related protein